MRIRNVLVNFLVILVSLVFAFLLIEGIATIFLPAPRAEKWPLCIVEPDSLLGWRMHPHNFHYTYTFPVRLNSYGLRDDELASKKENEIRILVLGDSHVYGQGLGNDQLFTTILENQLNATDEYHRYNVINAGVRAYSVNQEIGFLKHVGMAMEPDIVVLCFYINDFLTRNLADYYKKMIAAHFESGYIFDLERPPTESAFMKWKLVQFLRKFRFTMFLHDRLKGWQSGDDYRFKLLHGKLDEDVSRMRRRAEEHIKKFGDLVASTNIQGIICVIPVATQINNDFQNEGYQTTLREYANRYGLDYLDLLPAFKAYYYKTRRMPVIPYDGHYDSIGHQIISMALYDFLGKTK